MDHFGIVLHYFGLCKAGQGRPDWGRPDQSRPCYGGSGQGRRAVLPGYDAAWSECVGKDGLKRASAFKPDLARLSARMLKRDLSKWVSRVFGDQI